MMGPIWEPCHVETPEDLGRSSKLSERGGWGGCPGSRYTRRESAKTGACPVHGHTNDVEGGGEPAGLHKRRSSYRRAAGVPLQGRRDQIAPLPAHLCQTRPQVP